MDREVIWSEPAINDIREIAEYIASDNPDAALRLGDDVFLKTAQLANFPNTGKRFPDAKPKEVFEIPCRGYRIFYQFTNKAVEILHVRHGARDEPQID